MLYCTYETLDDVLASRTVSKVYERYLAAKHVDEFIKFWLASSKYLASISTHT